MVVRKDKKVEIGLLIFLLGQILSQEKENGLSENSSEQRMMRLFSKVNSINPY